MPTVTVFAWCLIASIGRVSSSMPTVSAAARSSSTTAGVPTLPYSIWYASSGELPSAKRSSDATLLAVEASMWPLSSPVRSRSKNEAAVRSSVDSTDTSASSPLI